LLRKTTKSPQTRKENKTMKLEALEKAATTARGQARRLEHEARQADGAARAAKAKARQAKAKLKLAKREAKQSRQIARKAKGVSAEARCAAEMAEAKAGSLEKKLQKLLKKSRAGAPNPGRAPVKKMKARAVKPKAKPAPIRKRFVAKLVAIAPKSPPKPALPAASGSESASQAPASDGDNAGGHVSEQPGTSAEG
jgi:hypothetical protein